MGRYRRAEEHTPQTLSSGSTGRSTPDWPTPRSRRSIAELGGMAMPGSPADFGKFVAAETKKWGDVIKFANIKPE